MTFKPPIFFSPERAPYFLYGLAIISIVLALINFSLLISTIQFFTAGFCVGTGIGIHLTARHRKQTKAFWHDAMYFAEKSKKMSEEMSKELDRIKNLPDE